VAGSTLQPQGVALLGTEKDLQAPHLHRPAASAGGANSSLAKAAGPWDAAAASGAAASVNTGDPSAAVEELQSDLEQAKVQPGVLAVPGQVGSCV